MDSRESQNEEREVLQSIYEGDPNFKEISPTCFQYKYVGEENEQTAFLVEIKWPQDYPEIPPLINLDLFLNSNLPDSLKEQIKSDMLQQTKDLIGTPMTYSLLDWTQENAKDIIDKIPEFVQRELTAVKIIQDVADKPKKEKKEQLTKSQKRKLTSRTDFKGERERGWDWVDVIKHLYQTGYQAKE